MTLNLNYKNWDYTWVILLLMFLAAALSSCGPQISDETISEDSHKIQYFKDERTGLCFGNISSYSYGLNEVASFTCVPCDSVKHLLK